MADKYLDKVYLTPKEAAAYLRNSPHTLLYWRQRKKGPPYIKLGEAKKAAILYRRSDLDEWLAKHLVENGRDDSRD
jgi:hypothetical protein